MDDKLLTSRFTSHVSRLLWWLVPLLWIGFVLFTSYSAITARRYGSINGVPGELLPGGSFGQSFVSRYPNLSGVEVQVGTYRAGGAPASASLILHLRAAPTPGPDIATARLPVGYVLEENPWYLFRFPPIPDSQNRAYYIEIESPDSAPGRALTLFWWQRIGEGDPYPYGVAYRDGTPQSADLAFGLSYSPSPLDAWAQVARAASANLPLWMMLVAGLAVAASVAWCILRLPRLLRDRHRLDRWLARRSLPIVLLAALVTGSIYIGLVPPWQGPDEHQHFAYAALLDKFGLDNDKVKAIPSNSEEATLLASAINASMLRHDFSRRVAGYSAPGAPTDTGPSLLDQVRQAPAYYWLCALSVRAARTLGFNADPYANPEGALIAMRVVSLALNMVVVALAWLAGALLSPGGRPRLPLRLLMPLTVALFPMHTFVASVVNNDIMAEAAVSALFVTLLALLRRPTGVRGVGLAMLAVLLTLAGSATKPTALSAAVPLLALGLTVWLGMLLMLLLRKARPSMSTMRSAVLAPLMLVLLALVVAGLGVAFAYRPEGTAAGWIASTRPLRYAPRLPYGEAHEGAYVLKLGGTDGPLQAQQSLLPTIYHPAMLLHVSGWSRPGEDGQAGNPSTARLSIYEGSREAGAESVLLDKAADWTPISATARISASGEQVTVYLQAEGGKGSVLFDDLSVRVETPGESWRDPVFRLELANPSAEVEGRELQPLLKSALPQEAEHIASVPANPQPFSKGELWARYADMQARSFWGSFGWLSMPLPGLAYTVLGALAVMALLGLGWRGVRRVGRWSASEWLALVSLLSFALAVLIGFARQTSLIITNGVAAFPQGRYLFVMIIPASWLLIAGLWSLGSPLATWAKRWVAKLGREAGESRPLPWGRMALGKRVALPLSL